MQARQPAKQGEAACGTSGQVNTPYDFPNLRGRQIAKILKLRHNTQLGQAGTKKYLLPGTKTQRILFCYSFLKPVKKLAAPRSFTGLKVDTILKLTWFLGFIRYRLPFCSQPSFF